MARRATRVACALALGAALGPANAQTLTLLHLRTFALSVDRTSVAPGDTIHLTLDARVDERIQALDNVQLPSLAGFADLGDERRCTQAASGPGSDCVETLTLSAAELGERALGPATIEFLDAASGKLVTRDSNVVVVRVGGGAAASGDGASLAGAGWSLLRSLGVIASLGLAVLALWWGFGRRRAAPAVPFVPAPLAPPARPAWAARRHELGTLLAGDPSRERALAVRAELRAHLGAAERETFGDLRQRTQASSPSREMQALAAVERAAFCEDSSVAAAAREAVPFLMV